MDNYYEELTDILEEDEIKDEDILEDFEEWDSLTVLSIIAFIDKEYDVKVSAHEVDQSKTVGALKDLIIDKSKKEA